MVNYDNDEGSYLNWKAEKAEWFAGLTKHYFENTDTPYELDIRQLMKEHGAELTLTCLKII